MKKRILVVGFGGMGCRHAQSLHNAGYEVTIIERNKHIIQPSLNNIQKNKEDFIFIESLDELSGFYDLAVVATSSEPRFIITRNLITYGIKKFLLEKIVFQNQKQFDEIINLMNSQKVEIFTNFVNRYVENYQILKSDLRKNEAPLKMTVSGNLFGLGCNSIHYVDLFRFLTERSLESNHFKLEEDSAGNKRGMQYKEFYGKMTFSNQYGDFLNIHADPNFSNEILISLHYQNICLIINENLQIVQKFNFDTGLTKTEPLYLHYTSTLTSRIVDDIIKGKCVLSDVKETYYDHLLLFNIFNTTLGLSPNEKCPIT